ARGPAPAPEASPEEAARQAFLEEALRPPPRDESKPEESAVPARATHPGKVERLERRRREAHRSSAPGGEDGAAGKSGAASDGLIRMESESYGTPGLVLVRAMEGAQSIGYTILTVDDRDLYFIALKRASVFQTFVGTQRGACKIAVGTEKKPDDTFTRIYLKARPHAEGAEKLCQRDLEKILGYGRGEISDKHKKRKGRVRPSWSRPDAP
ncbi:MAG: hypothetical protein ACE5FC_09155, partial [Myxococcota bacterium]